MSEPEPILADGWNIADGTKITAELSPTGTVAIRIAFPSYARGRAFIDAVAEARNRGEAFTLQLRIQP